jgi:hypothetical protein
VQPGRSSPRWGHPLRLRQPAQQDQFIGTEEGYAGALDDKRVLHGKAAQPCELGFMDRLVRPRLE